MFRVHVLIIRRSKLHYTASGIITLIDGRLVHGLREIKIFLGCSSLSLINETRWAILASRDLQISDVLNRYLQIVTCRVGIRKFSKAYLKHFPICWVLYEVKGYMFSRPGTVISLVQIHNNNCYRCNVHFEICVFHTPTNSLLINLVKSLNLH